MAGVGSAATQCASLSLSTVPTKPLLSMEVKGVEIEVSARKMP